MLGLRPKPRRDDPHRRALEAGLRERLALGEDDGVKVYEVACGIPDCPDVVTAVLVVRADLKTEVYRVAKAMLDATVDDLAEAMRAAEASRRGIPLAQMLSQLRG